MSLRLVAIFTSRSNVPIQHQIWLNPFGPLRAVIYLPASIKRSTSAQLQLPLPTAVVLNLPQRSNLTLFAPLPPSLSPNPPPPLIHRHSPAQPTLVGSPYLKNCKSVQCIVYWFGSGKLGTSCGLSCKERAKILKQPWRLPDQGWANGEYVV